MCVGWAAGTLPNICPHLVAHTAKLFSIMPCTSSRQNNLILTSGCSPRARCVARVMKSMPLLVAGTLSAAAGLPQPALDCSCPRLCSLGPRYCLFHSDCPSRCHHCCRYQVGTALAPCGVLLARCCVLPWQQQHRKSCAERKTQPALRKQKHWMVMMLMTRPLHRHHHQPPAACLLLPQRSF